MCVRFVRRPVCPYELPNPCFERSPRVPRHWPIAPVFRRQLKTAKGVFRSSGFLTSANWGLAEVKRGGTVHLVTLYRSPGYPDIG